MSKEIKILGQQSFIYGIGTILTRGLGFFLIPLYTHYLSPQDYGILEMLDTTGAIIGMFIAMGITNSILRFHGYFNETKDKNEVISSALMFSVISGAAIVILLMSISGWFSIIIFKNSAYAFYFNLVFINIYLAQIHTHCKTIFRVKGKAKAFTIVSVLTTLFAMVLNIYFIAILQIGIRGLYYASITAFSIITSIILIKHLRVVGIYVSIKKIKEMLKYGIFFTPALLIVFVINSSDRYFLKFYTDLQTVGIYSLGYKIGMIVMFLVGFPFSQAWGAYAFDIVKKNNAKEIYSKVLTYYTLITIFVVLAISIYSKEIIVLMAPISYMNAYTIIPLISLSAFFYAINNVTTIGILIKKKTYYLPFINGFIAIINIGLNFLLIPRIGMYGAAISTAFSFLSLQIIGLIISNRLYYIRYEINRLLKIFAISIILYCISINVQFNNIVLSIFVKSIVLCSFPFCLFGIRFFSIQEKEDIARLLKKAGQFMNAKIIRQGKDLPG